MVETGTVVASAHLLVFGPYGASDTGASVTFVFVRVCV